MTRAILAVLLTVPGMPAHAQDAKSADPAPLTLTTQQDHRLMMEALGIKSLREGANGMNPNAPNAANFDEAKVRSFTLPDPLVCKDGTKVTTPELWWNRRRPEIVEDFDREAYGRVPRDVPRVTWEVVETKEEKLGEIPAVTRGLLGHVDNSRCPQIKVDIQLTLTTPRNAKGPVPVIMEFGFAFGGFGPRPGGPPRKTAAQAVTPPAHKDGPEGGLPRRVRLRCGRPAVAAARTGEGLGLCRHRPQQHPGRRWRRTHPGDHRPVQQGTAAQAR